MKRKERRKLVKICNAKDLVCKTCVSHNKNACVVCPITNLIDDEMHVINGTQKDEFAEVVSNIENNWK